MVLKTSGRGSQSSADKPERCGGRAFTVIELLVGMGLAVTVALGAYSIYLRFYKAVNERQKIVHFHKSARIYSSSLKRQVMSSGIKKLGPADLQLVMTEGRILDYHFDSDVLNLNNELFPLKVFKFNVEASGPVYTRFNEYEFESDQILYGLRALDKDADGQLSFQELDLDESGVLEGDECAKIGIVKITLGFIHGEDSLIRVIEAHPRNPAFRP